MKSKYVLIGAFLLLIVLVLATCSRAPAPAEMTPCPTAEPCPDYPDCPPAPECPVCEVCPEVVVEDVPYEEQWADSPHNDVTAEAFNHWNEDDPQEVPTTCAKCHSTPGYLDFLGEDGSEAGVVDNAAPIGTTVQCIACHNESAANMTSVVFPSAVEITNLGPEARCMQCHQGRASKLNVDEALAENGLTEDLDSVSEELGFIDIHYFAAAATLYGSETKGGYEYDGKSYDFKNDHVEGFDSCIGCHNQHTLELTLEECTVCHTDVTSVEDVRNIRMAGSLVDYDGDGDIEEGISFEIVGLQGTLLQAIQAYASEVAGTPIAYNPASYPYWFDDAGEGYASWTGRLLKAAYNYQMATKDPGAFAHGGKYIIQLLYDSIEDLNSAISSPVTLSTATT